MTRVLIWGSRNLTWKHMPVMRAVALHASLELHPDERIPPLGMDLMRLLMAGGDDEWKRLADGLVLLNGDGPAGTKVRGAVGADKFAVFACMETWPERRRVKWFPPEPKEGESWAQAAARRDVEMAEARPDRAYVVHENLDASRGSIITANALTRLGIRYDYLRVSPAGDLLSVERR